MSADVDGSPAELDTELETLKATVADYEQQARFSVRARSAAWWSTGVAAAALAGLVVSLMVGEGDKLAETALILAVVAFTLQIGFFVIQVLVASEQNRRGAQLASEANSVMVRIDAQLDATVAVIRDQFAFVLKHALARQAEQSVSAVITDDRVRRGQGAEALEDEGSEPENGADALARMEQRLTRLMLDMNRGRDTLQQWDEISRVPPSQSSRPPFVAAKRRLTSWPSEALGRPTAEILHQLSREAFGEMQRLSDICVRHLKRGTMPPHSFTLGSAAAADSLVAAGFVEQQSPEGSAEPVVSLTDDGHTALRLISAQGGVPDWYQPFNDRIEQHREQ